MTRDQIVFVCSRLDNPGGSEKAVIQTANLLSSKGHKVSLLILDETDLVFFPVLPAVEIISAPLHFGNTREGNMLTRKLAFQRHVNQLRSILDKIGAGTIVATEYHLAITTYLAARKLDANIYAWEHHHFRELRKSRFWNYLLHKCYPRLHGVICLNEDEAKLFEAIGAKTIVIPNFIERHQPTAGLSSKTILTVARLSPVKGIDILLEVAKKVLKNHPGWKWKLVGDGAMKDIVLKTITDENLEDRLLFQQPVSEDLSKEYSESAIYVMTSRNECFPMVLLEAMSYGVPCIAFDCETGPRHIIEDRVDGLLIENGNIEKMIEAIHSLVNNEEKRNQLALAAKEKVLQFSPQKISDQWKQLLQQ